MRMWRISPAEERETSTINDEYIGTSTMHDEHVRCEEHARYEEYTRWSGDLRQETVM